MVTLPDSNTAVEYIFSLMNSTQRSMTILKLWITLSLDVSMVIGRDSINYQIKF